MIHNNKGKNTLGYMAGNWDDTGKKNWWLHKRRLHQTHLSVKGQKHVAL